MRISVFLDGANFFYTQQHLGWKIDPKRLLDWVRTCGNVVDAFYYIGLDPGPDTKRDGYLNALTYMGYALVTKPVKLLPGQNGEPDRKKANLDIEIVLDMFNTIEHYDMAVLITGDSDFERALSLLRARGRKFMVMSTTGIVARELRSVAGMHFVDFTEVRDKIEKLNGGPRL